MSFKYLKDDVYYNDLYDRFTIEEGRRIELRHTSGKTQNQKEPNIKEFAHEFFLYHFKGNRYKNKSTSIDAWKREAERKDHLIDSSKPLENIHCLQCNRLMQCEDKELWEHNKKEEILFLYLCDNCKQRRSFYSDSKEYRPEKKKCQKCFSYSVNEKSSKIRDDLTITTTCLDCSHIEIFSFDLHKEKIDLNFVKDRERFCLTEEEGSKYLEDILQMEQMNRLMKEMEERDEIRKEKLKEYPEGFHLFDGEGYTCPICNSSMTGKDTWFDSYGQKCMKCKKNIEDGVIPANLSDYEKRNTWLSTWTLKDQTGLHSSTIKKMVKTGDLKARSLLDSTGYIYCQIFLVSENKEFLEKYKK